MSRRVMQFGTSRFLQAHIDLFIHEARQAGQDIGPITIVKTTPSGPRDGRVLAFRNPDGFPVRIRGQREGAVVDEQIQVRSVDSALSTSNDWPEIVRFFANEIELAVSNVGDAGYGLDETERWNDDPAAAAPNSFPGKLLALFAARYRAGGRPLLFLPLELKPSNGQLLRGLVLGLAERTGAPADFQHWLASAITFGDTLVDRIVSEPIEPVGAIAEPYALLAVRAAGFALPFTHSSVRLVDDLEPYERLKLHILNLGHSFLAEAWQRGQRPADETVRQILDDADVAQSLDTLYASEVIPGFASRDMADAARDYVATTLERFRNPFLNHRLADIAGNHPAKIGIRVTAFIAWVHAADPTVALPRLTALSAAYS